MMLSQHQDKSAPDDDEIANVLTSQALPHALVLYGGRKIECEHKSSLWGNNRKCVSLCTLSDCMYGGTAC